MRHQGSRVLRQASYERIQITEELALRVAALAVEDRHFKEENLKLLVQLYEAHPSGEVLRAIVMQLLFGRQRDPKWFCWYQKAIEEGLQFMGLYEAYIASMPGDFDGMLPKELVVYYSFHNELPEELKEIL